MDETGVISMISKDLCAVSVNINGTSRTLSFGKRVFYTYGNQCEGDMANILEEGMEVNVCYELPESQDTPSVVAVWIGDKPDISHCVEPLVDVYNQRGYVDGILDDGSFIVSCDREYSVVVNKKVVYIDRCLLALTRSWIAVGDCLLFDAVPLKFPHASGAMYQATCAWIGKEPTLVDRFSLKVMDSVEEKLDILKRNRVYGTVVVIPNEVLAFVKVQDLKMKIMLFRSSFDLCCERIQDVVNVGDRLCMQLCFEYLFDNCRQWFATRAWKSVEEVTEENNFVEITRPIAVLQQTAKSANDPNSVAANQQTLENEAAFNERSEVLYNDLPLMGTFFFVSTQLGLISYKSLWIKVRRCNVYMNGSLSDPKSIYDLGHYFSEVIVCFEAVKIHPKEELLDGKKVTHDAICVWIGQKPSLLTVAALNPACSLLKIEEVTYCGRVSKFYLPDIALVTIEQKERPVVYVHVSSFLSDSQHSSRHKITDFVKLDVLLSFKVTRDSACSFILRAVNVIIKAKDKYEDLRKAVSENDHEKLREKLGGECNYGELDDKKPAVSFNKNSKAVFTGSPLRGIIWLKKQRHSIEVPVITCEGLDICVHKRDVFIKGQPCTKEQFSFLINSKVVVNYEAFSNSKEAFRSECPHRTACVWVGEKPSLSVVASTLGNCVTPVLNYDDPVTGIVKGFYLPGVALLEVGASMFKFVVCLHLNEVCRGVRHPLKFKDNGNYCITDFVEPEDQFEFKVMKNDQCSLGLCAYNVKKCKTAHFHRSKKSEAQMPAVLQNFENVSDYTSKAVPFAPEYSLAKRSLVLNCVGWIRVDLEKMTAKMVHKFGSSNLDTSIGCERNGICVKRSDGLALVQGLDDRTLSSFICNELRFDAVFVATSEGGKLCVQKIWLTDYEHIIASKLTSQRAIDFNPSTLYCGVITSTDLHNVAIAMVDEVSVLVTLDAIVANKTDPSFASVDIFFSVGDHVVLKIKVVSTAAGSYCKATACYKLQGVPISPKDGRQVTPWREPTWSSFWETGEYFITGLAEKRNGDYFVDFVSSKHPGTMSSFSLSTAFEAGMFFVHGKPFKESGIYLHGREVSFHVARHHCTHNEAVSSKETFIKVAWIGNYPELAVLLQHQAMGLKDLICKTWCYEGVVAYFPLPTHAICKVGVFFVSLLLTPIKVGGKIVGFVESDLSIGSRVVLMIQEQFCGKDPFLVSTLSTSVKKLYDGNEVLKVVRGKVIKLPYPQGKIRVDGAFIEVWFDRTSVLSINGTFRTDASIFQWANFLDESLNVGTDVYFSAAKDLTIGYEYRAYEVWIGKLPK